MTAVEGTGAVKNGERPKRLLFICHENCNRSQMAEAFARIAGTRPQMASVTATR